MMDLDTWFYIVCRKNFRISIIKCCGALTHLCCASISIRPSKRALCALRINISKPMVIYLMIFHLFNEPPRQVHSVHLNRLVLSSFAHSSRTLLNWWVNHKVVNFLFLFNYSIFFPIDADRLFHTFSLHLLRSSVKSLHLAYFMMKSFSLWKQ